MNYIHFLLNFFTFFPLIITGMEQSPEEKLLNFCTSQKEAHTFLTLEHAIQNKIFCLEELLLKLSYEKTLVAQLAHLLTDKNFLGEITDPEKLSKILQCYYSIETNIKKTLHTCYNDANISTKNYAESLKHKYTFNKHLMIITPLAIDSLIKVENRVISLLKDPASPHMKFFKNSENFDPIISHAQARRIRTIDAAVALPAIKVEYTTNKIEYESTLKTEQHLKIYQEISDFFLLKKDKLPQYNHIDSLLLKCKEYKNNIKAYFDTLATISAEKQNEYIKMLKDNNNAVTKTRVPSSTIKDHIEIINQYIAKMDDTQNLLDSHPFMNKEIALALKRSRELHCAHILALKENKFSLISYKEPLCKVEMQPLEKEKLGAFLKQTNMHFGWRKLSAYNILGFAAEEAIKEDYEYTNIVYFTSSGQKISEKKSSKANSRKTLFNATGLLFSRDKDEPDFIEFEINDNSPTTILYNHAGSYYYKNKGADTNAYLIDKIFGITKKLPSITLNPTSGKIQNPTTDGK